MKNYFSSSFDLNVSIRLCEPGVLYLKHCFLLTNYAGNVETKQFHACDLALPCRGRQKFEVTPLMHSMTADEVGVFIIVGYTERFLRNLPEKEF